MGCRVNMPRIIINIGYLISRTGRFILLPLLLLFTFNAHEFVHKTLQLKFLWACVFFTLFYMQYLILYLYRRSTYKQYIGVTLMLIASILMTLSMFVAQGFAVVGVDSPIFDNYAVRVSQYGYWIAFGLLVLWVTWNTHKWRSDLIVSQPYDPDVVMFGAKVPNKWIQFWWALLQGDALNAHIGMVNGKLGRFNSKTDRFEVVLVASQFDMDDFVLRRAEDITPIEFQAYLESRSGEKFDAKNNNCYEWGNYNVRKYFK